MNTKYQQPQYAIGVGEALWDVLPEGKKLGGAPANFAYHISQFGEKSARINWPRKPLHSSTTKGSNT